MPTINIIKTVSNLASVTGLSFTATAVQGSNTFPLTASYSAPNLTLTSAGNIGVSGNFTFNVTANYTAFGTACSDSISFVEQVTNNFTNLDWNTQSGIPNQANPFAEDNVGWTWNRNFVLGGGLRNKDTSDFLKLKTGNEEAIIEFYYFSNTFTAGDRISTMIEFVYDNGGGNERSFGITRSNHCGGYGALHQAYLRWYSSLGTLAYFHAGGNCSNPAVLFPNLFYQIDIPYIDVSRMGQTYPKTMFKMRMINGIYELYKNDILVGSVPYDNTVEYTFTFGQLGNATNVNMGIQLIKVEGNFE